MTHLVGFLLSVAAVGLMLSVLSAGLALAIDVFVVWCLRLSAARHADVRLALGVLPAIMAGLGAGLTALPPLLAAMGVIADHCLSHAHHAHLCPVHFAGVHTRMLALGAMAMVVAGVSGGVCLVRMLREHQLLASIRLLGNSIDVDGVPVVLVAGGPRLLHAGIGFVVASRSLLNGLSPASQTAALAHEVAHVRRRDAVALRLLSLAAPLSPPGFGRRMRRLFIEAAEEAADAAAAVVVGPEAVARAIIDVARLRGRSHLDALLPCCAVGVVERRVLRLLEHEHHRHSSSALVLVAVAIVSIGLLSIPAADEVHHLVETLLFSWR